VPARGDQLRHARRFASRTCQVLAAALLAGALTGIVPGGASASTCFAWTGAQPQNVGRHDNTLSGVSAVSPCDAWAVGFYSTGTVDQTLIEHWNGTAWTLAATPNPGGSLEENFLSGVTALPPHSALAVGGYFNGTRFVTLGLHWTGAGWKRVATANPPPADNFFNGVTATSATNVWAVGARTNRTRSVNRTLAVHCC